MLSKVKATLTWLEGKSTSPKDALAITNILAFISSQETKIDRLREQLVTSNRNAVANATINQHLVNDFIKSRDEIHQLRNDLLICQLHGQYM